MIDVIRQTPSEYSAQSRDYQVIARLYTALFNISKMYIDDMQVWNNNIDNKLTTLRAKTLNFDAKRAWADEDLEAVTSCFKYLMINKGTIKALEYCANILMKIENVEGEEIDNPVTIDENYNVTIRIPENLFTIGILEDLVEYLLPAGLIYNIIRYKVSGLGSITPVDIYVSNGDVVMRSSPYDDKMFISSSKSTDANYITDTFVYSSNQEFKEED